MSNFSFKAREVNLCSWGGTQAGWHSLMVHYDEGATPLGALPKSLVAQLSPVCMDCFGIDVLSD